MELSSLAEIEELYQQIMRSPAGEARDRALSRLMTNMEIEYHIPALQSPEWESKNKAVIAMYRKLSMSRTTV
jgi:hypothetical protein